ncbi:MAG: cytochrome c biogenesis protein CcdA [Patescibacteria group bacterium]
MTLLLISFIAGVLTILAPCILPLLPVIVGGSLDGDKPSKKRAIVVVVSLGVSVIAFTLLLKASTLFIDIPQDFWRWASGGIILVFGLVTLFPGLWERMSLMSSISRKSNEAMTKGLQKKSFWGDVIVGASLGPIFSACSPTYFVILATVLPAQPVLGIIYLLTYAVGLCIALLLVAFAGQNIMVRLGIAADPRGWFKRTLGVIFIVVAIGIITGYDKTLQISILDAGFLDVTKIELLLLEKNK